MWFSLFTLVLLCFSTSTSFCTDVSQHSPEEIRLPLLCWCQGAWAEYRRYPPVIRPVHVKTKLFIVLTFRTSLAVSLVFACTMEPAGGRVKVMVTR